MLSYLGLKGKSKELIWEVKGFVFKEFKFKEERNRKPLYNIPFRGGASPRVPTSQLMPSLTLRAAQPVHMSKSKP